MSGITVKTALVTGASSGIGEAIAWRLAADGHHVVLGARRVDRLDDVVERIVGAGGSAETRQLDVTDRAAFTAVVDGVVEDRGRLDVLVNNAGVMLLSRLDALLADQWQQMFDVNVTGLLNGIGAVLPHLRRQGGGHVITIASVGAREVVQTSAVYSGTKFAARAITEGLRVESDPSIRVTTVSPGVVDSELATHITDPAAREAMVAYRAAALSAEAIAAAVSFAVSQPEGVDVNELTVRPTRQR